MSLDPNKVPEVEQVEQSAAEQDASEEDDEDSGQDDEAADTNEAEDDEEEAATPVARLKQEVARLEQELTAANKKLKDKEYVDQELAQVPQKLDAVDHLNKRLAKRAEHLERNHIKAGMTRVEIADAFFRQLAENAPEEAEGALAEVASRVQAKAAAPEQPAPEPTAEAPAEQQAAVEQPAAEQTAAEQTDLLDIPAFLRRQAKTAEPTEEAPAEQVAVEPEPPGASDARLSRSSQEEPLVPSSQGEAPPQTYWPSKPKRRPAIHTHRFAGRYETLKDGEIYCEPSDAHAEDWVILRYDRLQEGGKTQWLPVKKYSSREEAKADWAAFIARMKSSVMAEELAAEEPELVSS